MKKVFLLAFSFLSVISVMAQSTVTGDRVVAKTGLYVKDTWIDSIQRDTGFLNQTRAIPTSEAVRKYVATHSADPSKFIQSQFSSKQTANAWFDTAKVTNVVQTDVNANVRFSAWKFFQGVTANVITDPGLAWVQAHFHSIGTYRLYAQNGPHLFCSAVDGNGGLGMIYNDGTTSYISQMVNLGNYGIIQTTAPNGMSLLAGGTSANKPMKINGSFINLGTRTMVNNVNGTDDGVNALQVNGNATVSGRTLLNGAVDNGVDALQVGGQGAVVANDIKSSFMHSSNGNYIDLRRVGGAYIGFYWSGAQGSTQFIKSGTTYFNQVLGDAGQYWTKVVFNSYNNDGSVAPITIQIQNTEVAKFDINRVSLFQVLNLPVTITPPASSSDALGTEGDLMRDSSGNLYLKTASGWLKFTGTTF